MQLSLNDILKQIPSASTDDLQKLLDATSKELEFRKLRHYVEYVPEVLDISLGDQVIKKGFITMDQPYQRALYLW